MKSRMQNPPIGWECGPPGMDEKPFRANHHQIAARTVPGRLPAIYRYQLGALVAESGRPKVAFLKIQRIENGTQSKFFIRDRQRDPLKTIHVDGCEKHEK